MTKKVRLVSITVFLADIAVLIIVLAILWTMSHRNQTDQCEMMCIDNSHCGCRTETLQEYLKKVFDDKFNKVELKRKTAQKKKSADQRHLAERLRKMGHSWNIKPIARLSGSKQIIRNDDSQKEMMPVRKWEQEGRRYCYVRNGMGYRNGRLVIPEKGFYHVYSFLDLLLEYSNGNGQYLVEKKPSDAIQHAIFKFNIKTGKEEEILATYRPYRKASNGRFSFYETYLSADVSLESGDEVYLKVSNISYIKYPSKNFFGIHML